MSDQRLLCWTIHVCLMLWTLQQTSATCRNRSTKLGRVKSVSYSRDHRRLRAGDNFEARVKIDTKHPVEANWRFVENVWDDASNRTRVLNVPNSVLVYSGEIKAHSVVNGSVSELVIVFADSFVPGFIEKLDLHVYLKTPCNDVKISAKLETWKNMSGTKLPTLLAVPGRSVDFSLNEKVNVSIGLKLNDRNLQIGVFRYRPYVVSERKNGVLRTWDLDNEVLNAAWIGDELPWDWSRVNRFSGTIEYSKGVGYQDMESQVVRYFWIMASKSYVESHGRGTGRFQLFTGDIVIDMLTRFQLQFIPQYPVPWVGAYSEEYESSLMTGRSATKDSQDNLVLPIVDQPDSSFPKTFVCFAEHSKGRCTLTALRLFIENGKKAWKALREFQYEERGNSLYNFYTIDPPIPVGGSDLIICTADFKGAVKSEVIRIENVARIDVSTPNTSPVVLGDDTFQQGYRFTCKASELRATYSFYMLPSFYRYVSASQLLSYDMIESSDSINITLATGEAYLDFGAGFEPPIHYALMGNSFKLLCVAKGRFTTGAAYVDFREDSTGNKYSFY